ncbi:MAG TPA: SHOCT domain-containing protein [Syntrophales bacterium]|nr:SHOCT domain-containing protein [Syntrophales bacterium]
MKTVRMLSALMIIVFGLSIAACCGGGTTTVQETQTQVQNPTAVNELLDLDNAYKNGAITKEEYEKLRQDILNKAAR